MISCKDVTEQASAYLDKDMPLNQRMGVRLHLLICRNCRRYMEQLRTAVLALGLMKKDVPLGEENTRWLVERFKQAFRRPREHEPD